MFIIRNYTFYGISFLNRKTLYISISNISTRQKRREDEVGINVVNNLEIVSKIVTENTDNWLTKIITFWNNEKYITIYQC